MQDSSRGHSLLYSSLPSSLDLQDAAPQSETPHTQSPFFPLLHPWVLNLTCIVVGRLALLVPVPSPLSIIVTRVSFNKSLVLITFSVCFLEDLN